MSWTAGIKLKSGNAVGGTDAEQHGGGAYANLLERFTSVRTAVALGVVITLVCLDGAVTGFGTASSVILVLASSLLAVSLAVSVVRARGLMGVEVADIVTQPSTTDADDYYPELTPTHSFDLTQDTIEACTEVRTSMRAALGFHVVSKAGGWNEMSRGLSHRRLTWLFHAGVLLCIAGALLTYLFAYEGTVTIAPGEPTAITAESPGRIQRLLGIGAAGPTLTLEPAASTTARTSAVALVYPEDPLSRLATGLRWGSVAYDPASVKRTTVRDWSSRVTVGATSEDTPYEQVVAPGRPLRAGGRTITHRGFQYTYHVRIADNPLLLVAEAGTEVVLPGVSAPVVFGPLRTGSIEGLDGKTTEIEPLAPVSVFKGVDLYGRRVYEDAGAVYPGSRMTFGATTITVAGVTEAAVLGYRYDPGAGVVKWAGLFVVVVMALRLYAPWYAVTYRVRERTGGIARLEMRITTRGFFADADRMAEKLRRDLSKNEVPLEPV